MHTYTFNRTAPLLKYNELTIQIIPRQSLEEQKNLPKSRCVLLAAPRCWQASLAMQLKHCLCGSPSETRTVGQQTGPGQGLGGSKRITPCEPGRNGRIQPVNADGVPKPRPQLNVNHCFDCTERWFVELVKLLSTCSRLKEHSLRQGLQKKVVYVGGCFSKRLCLKGSILGSLFAQPGVRPFVRVAPGRMFEHSELK